MRLSTEFESYVFQLAQTAKSVNRILIVDDMITALIDHDKRALYQDFKETHSIRDNRV